MLYASGINRDIHQGRHSKRQSFALLKQERGGTLSNPSPLSPSPPLVAVPSSYLEGLSHFLSIQLQGCCPSVVNLYLQLSLPHLAFRCHLHRNLQLLASPVYQRLYPGSVGLGEEDSNLGFHRLSFVAVLFPPTRNSLSHPQINARTFMHFLERINQGTQRHPGGSTEEERVEHGCWCIRNVQRLR